MKSKTTTLTNHHSFHSRILLLLFLQLLLCLLLLHLSLKLLLYLRYRLSPDLLYLNVKQIVHEIGLLSHCLLLSHDIGGRLLSLLLGSSDVGLFS